MCSAATTSSCPAGSAGGIDRSSDATSPEGRRHRSGLRVLDLGTGLGHVARLAGQLVGPPGRWSDSIARRRRWRSRAGGSRRRESIMSRSLKATSSAGVPTPFDAIVGRLVLFHLRIR
jgi:hypothetical protein